METLAAKKLVRSVEAAATSLALLLLGQGVVGILANELVPLALPLGSRGSVLSILAGVLAVFARLRARRESTLAATIVAGLLVMELAGAVAIVGVPELPLPLAATFVALVYGGLAFLAVAAVCAAKELRAVVMVSPRPERGKVNVAASPRRRAA